MPFNRNHLQINRGSYNDSPGADSRIIHTYWSNDDTFATITASEYFPDYLGASAEQVKVDDLLYIKDSTDDWLSYRLSSLSPVTIVPENVSDNPFNQSLNTTNSVTFVSTTLTPQAANPGGTNTLWINSFDGHLYRDAVDIENATGDVTGPASSTDNAFARFDLATGKVIQNSAATLDDTGVPTFVDRINISANVYWDNGTISAGNVLFGFDTNDYLIFNNSASTLSFYGGATENFKATPGAAFEVETGIDVLSSGAFTIGGSNATTIICSQSLILNSVSNDDTQTQLLVWNSGSNEVEYRTLASLDFIDDIGSSTDNAIVRWDGASGDAIQDSGITIDDSDNLTIPAASQINTDTIGETTAAAGVTIDGVLLKDSNVTAANVNGTLFTDTSLSGGGTTLAQIDNSGILGRASSAVKTLYFPLDYNADDNGYRVRSIGATGAFNFTFALPQDFSAITNLVLVGWPSAGAAGTGKDIDLTSNYGGIGENVSAHSESDVVTTYNLGTTNEKFEIDISGIYSSVIAGDSCGLIVDHKGIGGSVNYIHIRLDYT